MGNSHLAGLIVILACCQGCHDSTGIAPDGQTDGTTDGTGWGECGNGRIDRGELCDGMDLGGQTCPNLGFLGGTLRCNTHCDGFELYFCTGGCGNDVAEGPAQGLAREEPCDGTDLRGHGCTHEGFELGNVWCLEDCSGFDTSECRDPVCGDHAIEGSEDCEPGVTIEWDCIDLGFHEGVLSCRDCRFDTTGCITWECGNGVLEGLEQCDGTIMRDDETCESLGHDAGILTCFPPGSTGECRFDERTCVDWECGNDVVEGEEDCEPGLVLGVDCTDLGYSGGTLGCTPGCRYDTSGCTP